MATSIQATGPKPLKHVLNKYDLLRVIKQRRAGNNMTMQVIQQIECCLYDCLLSVTVVLTHIVNSIHATNPN